MKHLLIAVGLLLSAAALAEAPNKIWINATGGLAFLSNVGTDKSGTFGAEMGADLDYGFDVAAFFNVDLFRSVAGNHERAYLTALEPALKLAEDGPVSFKLGLVVGAMHLSTLYAASTRLALGTFAQLQFRQNEHFQLGLGTSFVSTLGKGDNFKVIDPRLSVGYIF